MRALLDVVMLILKLYTYVIIGVAVMSWLINFRVINIGNDFVRSVWRTLEALTEPVLRPIRRVIPIMGGLDISPLVLLLAIFFLQRVIAYNLYPLAIGY